MWQKLFSLMQRMEKQKQYQALHGGLIMLIPVLLTGAFALVFQSFPIPGYIQFIHSFANGMIYAVLAIIYHASFGMLSVYATVFISLSYGRERSRRRKSHFGNIAASLIAFFIMSGCGADDFTRDSLGPKGMFIAIVSAMLGSYVYWKLKDTIGGKEKHFTDGIDAQFNEVLGILFPLIITTGLFAIVDSILCNVFDVTCCYQLFIKGANALFALPMAENVRAVMFIFISSCLWFFGIHGSDCLEAVADKYFIAADTANIQAVASGLAPQNIVTKGFFDVFVLMGGCGTAICLLIALMVFGKRRSNRIVSKMAAIPMIFNINEVMIFGLPVILNPIMLIPFLTVPLVSFAIAYNAMRVGLVPLVCADVEWTTPIIMGGYFATGSVNGIILQLINLIVGTLIYMPFVRLLDAQMDYFAQENYKELVELFQKSERTGEEIELSGLEGYLGMVAKSLAGDIVEVLQQRDYEIYYQPQYNYDGQCIGVESLFRWNHPVFGMIYPPLAVKLAGESNNLLKMDCSILDRVVSETDRIHKRFGEDIKISVNVTGYSVLQPGYAEYISRKYSRSVIENVHLCLELTEQTAVRFNSATAERFEQMKQWGISFAIDDFTMGQTSVDYLKGDIFTLIKLDGALIRGVTTNTNCYEIVASLTSLADSLGIGILAEYVETEEQRKVLHQIGCDQYQGCLFSPAVPLE